MTVLSQSATALPLICKVLLLEIFDEEGHIIARMERALEKDYESARQRQSSKLLSFGQSYGMTNRKLADMLGYSTKDAAETLRVWKKAQGLL